MPQRRDLVPPSFCQELVVFRCIASMRSASVSGIWRISRVSSRRSRAPRAFASSAVSLIVVLRGFLLHTSGGSIQWKYSTSFMGSWCQKRVGPGCAGFRRWPGVFSLHHLMNQALTIYIPCADLAQQAGPKKQKRPLHPKAEGLRIRAT